MPFSRAYAFHVISFPAIPVLLVLRFPHYSSKVNVCALRTNIVFFSTLFTLIFFFACGAGAFWNLALGNVHAGQRLTVPAGAFTFALTSMVWCLLASNFSRPSIFL